MMITISIAETPPPCSASSAIGVELMNVPATGMKLQKKTIVDSTSRLGSPITQMHAAVSTVLQMAMNICASSARPSTRPNPAMLSATSS